VRRVLGLRDLAVVSAASIGPAFSLATTMAAMIASAGRWTWLAVALVAVLMAMIAAGYSRLGELHRDAGSSYAWIRAAFGATAGAYGAWVLLVANVFAMLATALPAGAYTLDLVAPARAQSGPAVAAVACAWIAVAALLLWSGLRPTARLALALLLAEIAVLAAAACAAAAHARADAVAFSSAPPVWSGLAGAIVVGIWMMDGWEVSASAAEEAHGVPSAPGVGGFAGLVLAAAVMLAAIAAFERIGSVGGFAAHEDDALAYAGSLLGGAWRPLLAATVLVSLAASLQTTLVYLTRSVYAMGRDGVLPLRLGALDARDEPAASIVLIAGVSIAFTVVAALWPTARAAFDLALKGTAWFLGVLFVLTALAAVRIFASRRRSPLMGVALPGVAAAALTAILLSSLLTDDAQTRGFIAASAIIGLPLAAWRGRVVRASRPAGERSSTGSRF